MKRRRQLSKRITAWVLSLTLVLVTANLPEKKFKTVKAASVTPSITTYATKSQLMSEFKPNRQGTANSIGKLNFGKNDSKKTQEWYIIGKDDGITGDNVTIFSSSNMLSAKIYNEVYILNNYRGSNLLKIFQDMAVSSDYFSESEQKLMNPTTVGDEGYGIISDQGAAGNGNYIQYLVTDKLYAPQASNTEGIISLGTSGQSVQSNKFLLSASKYWNSGDPFWSRTGCDINFTGGNVRVLMPETGKWKSAQPNETYAVRPATNLNLTSVLFASAVKAPSSGTTKGTISANTAMTLRLDGSEKNIGKVAYNTAAKTIKISKGSTTKTVTLAVQGKDGSSDWYYCKTVTGTETLTTSTIKSALGLSADVDLTKCKIWMEVKDSDELIYAVCAKEIPSYSKPTIQTKQINYNNTLNDVYTSSGLSTALGIPKISDGNVAGTWTWVKGPSTKLDQLGQHTYQAMFNPTSPDSYIWDDVPGWNATDKCIKQDISVNVIEATISSVAISGITAPTANTTLDTTSTCSTTGIATKSPSVSWSPMPNGTKAGFDTTHTASVTIKPSYGYVFATSPTATVNGSTASSVKKNADGSLTVSKTFTSTAKRKISSITKPQNRTFSDYYTADSVLKSPELEKTIKVAFEAPEVSPATMDMDVTWSLESTYNTTPGAENTFRWTIDTSKYSAYDTTSNGLSWTGTITIKNKAATPVEITAKNSTVNFDEKDIDVSRFFTIDANAGNPTYSLIPASQDNTVTGEGSLNGNSLSVSKLGVFKVKLNTKAQGNYAAGQSILTLTVDYGIIDCTVTEYNEDYDGDAHSIALRVNSPSDTKVTYSKDGEKYTQMLPSFINAGEYKVYYRIEKENYATVDTFQKVIIKKLEKTPNKPQSTKEVPYTTKKVSDVTLPAGWIWQDDQKDIALAVGKKVTANALYDGTDKGNYQTECVEIAITRQPCTHENCETGLRDNKEASCTEKGYTGDTYCTSCDNTITEGKPIDELGHSYVNGVCSRCDDIFQTTIDGITYKVVTTIDEQTGKPIGQTSSEPGTESPMIQVSVIKIADTLAENVEISKYFNISGWKQTFVVSNVESDACDENTSVNIHTHSYEEDWTYNASHHWHASNCGHKEEISDKASHDFFSVDEKGNIVNDTSKAECSLCHIKNIACSELEVRVTNPEYTGKNVAPTVEIKWGDTLLKEDVDYTISFTEESEVGDTAYSLKIAGKGTYTGERTEFWNIGKRTPVEEDFVYTEPEELVYSGTEKTASVAVKDEFTQFGEVTIFYREQGTKNALITTAPTQAGSYDVYAVITEGKSNNAITVDNAICVGSFKIQKAEAEITVAQNQFSKTYGDNAFLLKVSKTGEGTLTYTSSDKAIVTVSDEGIVTIVGDGVATITVSMAETCNYNEADDKSITVNVDKAIPVEGTDYIIPGNITAICGDTLERVNLPDGFGWQEEDTSVLVAGETEDGQEIPCSAMFRKAHYKEKEVTILVNVIHDLHITQLEGNKGQEKHTHQCSNCKRNYREEACSGGKASCVSPAVCSSCNKPYGEVDDSIDGHHYKYDQPIYNWSEDGTISTISYACDRDGCKKDTNNHFLIHTINMPVASPVPTTEPTSLPSSSAEPTELPSETPKTTVEPTETPMATETPSATLTPSPVPTATVEPTETPMTTETPGATLTPSPVPTATVEPTETPIATEIPGATLTPSPLPTATVEPTETPSATLAPSPSPTATVEPTETPIATETPGATLTPSPSPTVTVEPTKTPSARPSVTPSARPTATPSARPTATPSTTPTATPTVTPSSTPIPAPTITPQATAKVATTTHAPKNTGIVKDDKGVANYRITSTSKKEVKYVRPTKKKAKSITISATVKIGGITYKVTGIGDDAFAGCKKLKTIIIKSTKLTTKTLSKKAFKGLTKKTIIKVPKKKYKAYKKLFRSRGLASKVKIKKN